MFKKNKKNGVNVTYYRKNYIRRFLSTVLVLFFVMGSLVAFFRKDAVVQNNAEYEQSFLLTYIQNYYYYNKNNQEEQDIAKERVSAITLSEVERIQYAEDITEAYVTDTSLKIYEKDYDDVTKETVYFYDVKVIVINEVSEREIITLSQQLTTLKHQNKYLVSKQPKSYVYDDFYIEKDAKEMVKKEQAELKKDDVHVLAETMLDDAEKTATRELIQLFLSLWVNDYAQAETLTKDSMYKIEENIMFDLENIYYESEKKDEEQTYVNITIPYTQEKITFTKKYLFVIKENKIINITEERNA